LTSKLTETVRISTVFAMIFAIFFLGCKKEKEVEKIAFDESNLPAIKIILLNGCGYQGVAGKVREILYQKNLDIIACSNAEKFIYDKTIIVVKKRDEQDLERLQLMTGIKRRIFANNKNSEASFYIIIGKDYQDYFE